MRKMEFTAETLRRRVLRTHLDDVNAMADLGSGYISLVFSASLRLCGEMNFEDSVKSC